MPSPAIATTAPAARRSATIARLSAGRTPARTASGRQADLAGHGGGGGRVVPRHHDDLQSVSAQAPDRVGAPGFHGVRQTEETRQTSVDSYEHHRLAALCRGSTLGRQRVDGHAVALQERSTANDHPVSFDAGDCSRTRLRVEFPRGRQLQSAVSGSLDNRRRERVLAGLFDSRGKVQELVRILPLHCTDRSEARPA